MLNNVLIDANEIILAALLESSDDEKMEKGDETLEVVNNDEWWSEFIEPKHLEDMNESGKLVMLFGILKESEMIEDKVYVISLTYIVISLKWQQFDII